jgi:Ca-activated chloride channel family protein
MSWFGFSALGAGFLFLLALPLVALYFLKLKRPVLSVPSLILWRQILADQRVNSPFHRFKRNLLLLLQLLLLAALCLAAMQPFWRSETSGEGNVAILIDRSASMAALDRADGTSRLAIAKERAASLIGALGSGRLIALISFGRTARQVSSFTSNKRVLTEALDAVEVDHVAGDLSEALRMAQAMAQSVPFDRVVLLSDGNLQERVDFDLPFTIDYQRLPAAGANMGIAVLGAQRDPAGGWAILVEVLGTKEARAPAMLEMLQDGQKIAEQRILLQEGRSRRVIFPLAGRGRSSLELRLRPTGFDALACDNRAYLELTAPRDLRITLDGELNAFRHALEAHDGIEILGTQGPGDGPASDLLITGRPGAEAGSLVSLHVGMVPPDATHLLAIDRQGTTVVDWQPQAPLLENVELGADLVLMDRPQWKEAARLEDLEALHYEVLAHGRTGPLLVMKRQAQRRAYWMLFHPDHSDFPYRVGFPIFVSNLMRIAMRSAGLLDVSGSRPHILPPRKLKPMTAYKIEGPGGSDRSATTVEEGLLSGVAASRVGWYALSAGGEQVGHVGLSLLEPAETMLRTVDKIAFKEIEVAAATAAARLDRPLWPFLAGLGLLFLLVEWWFFHRRP